MLLLIKLRRSFIFVATQNVEEKKIKIIISKYKKKTLKKS